MADYELTVEALGFSRHRQTGVQLTVGQNATLHFSLQVARFNQEITVTADASLMEPHSGVAEGSNVLSMVRQLGKEDIARGIRPFPTSYGSSANGPKSGGGLR